MTGCRCILCVDACRRVPGTFAPLEALRAIRAGASDDIMCLTIGGEHRRGRAAEPDYDVLLPRSIISEHVRAYTVRHYRPNTWAAHGRCIFFNVDQRCEIHDSGFKPQECREAFLCSRIGTAAKDIRPMWRSFVGRAVISIWERERKRNAKATRTKATPRRSRHNRFANG